MASLVRITLIKKFTYRGDVNEEFSNQYALTGSIPSDATAWKALADALIAEEKKCYTSVVAVVRAYGYSDDAEDAPSVWSYDYAAGTGAVAGTLSPSGTWTQAPGDAAVWVRWKTSRTNTNGKAIYLRKYFHGATFAYATSPDTVTTSQRTALDNLGTKLRDGSFLDARTIRSRTHAETILSSGSSPYVTTRTLKRRGKRP